MRVYTIGYGNRSPVEFFELLKTAGVRTLVDVREKPSGWSAAYKLAKDPDKGIQRHLSTHGIFYLWLREFGNPFRNCPAWREEYKTILASKWQVGYQQLLKTPPPVCLMCGCLKVEDCHRKYVADQLRELGHEIVHL